VLLRLHRRRLCGKAPRSRHSREHSFPLLHLRLAVVVGDEEGCRLLRLVEVEEEDRDGLREEGQLVLGGTNDVSCPTKVAG
jgi:hypothetical protein